MSWSYLENQAINFDPASIQFKPSGSFYKDIADFCELAKIKVHPCFKESKIIITQLTEAVLPKDLQEQSEDKKDAGEPEPKEIVTLTAYSRKIDKNSLFALQAALPSSKITSLKFANNALTEENYQFLVQAIADSNVNKLFVDWNTLPFPVAIQTEAKKEEEQKNEEEQEKPQSLIGRMSFPIFTR